MDVLVERLRMAEIHDITDRSSTTAYVMKSRPYATKPKSKSFRTGIIRHNCNCEGHLARKCRKSKSEKTLGKSRKHPKKEANKFDRSGRSDRDEKAYMCLVSGNTTTERTHG